jgi:hypothetical protein
VQQILMMIPATASLSSRATNAEAGARNEPRSGNGENPDHQGQRFWRGNLAINTFRQPQFQGRSEDLKGHVYDCVNICQANQYARTTKEIA